MMLIINKPSGLPVHAGPKGGETLSDHLESLRFGLPRTPELAHRLDKDTSGCLVLGRHARALAQLGRMFASGAAQKTYLAVVQGAPRQDEGRIDQPLAKRSPHRGWWMQTVPKGTAGAQEAVTDYRLLHRGVEGGLSVVALWPRTGRTHQLRAHLAHLGSPILGDAIYGGASRLPGGPRLHLHALQIELPPFGKADGKREGKKAGKNPGKTPEQLDMSAPVRPPVVACAPLPPHIRATLVHLGLDPEEIVAAARTAPVTPAPEQAK
ncbi:MAG: RluA family pseudouridine synthase [Xanthobacter sp.]